VGQDRHHVAADGADSEAGYAEDAYPFRSFHEHLHRRFDAFGPERMFWGTDITRMPCSWRQCVTVFTEELQEAPQAFAEARRAAMSAIDAVDGSSTGT